MSRTSSSPFARSTLALSLAILGASCGSAPGPTPGPEPLPAGAAASAAPVASASAAPTGAASASANAPAGWRSCGGVVCKAAATPAAAFAAILAEEKPLVVAFGEAHAQQGAEAVASTAWHATNELFPELGGKASDLVLELWIADPKCAAKTQAKVEAKQKEVTKTQAKSNPNEYVVLAEKAKSLGIQPHVIRPTCAEVDKIARAGDDAVLEMLSMITAHMKAQIAELRARPAAKDKIVVTYGGAMHNDLRPGEGRDGWSFGPTVAAATGDRYVEVDSVVPEYVKDTPAWTGQRWYAAHQETKGSGTTTVIRTGEHAYAIVLPKGVKRPE